jgi:hypothetical protein
MQKNNIMEKTKNTIYCLVLTRSDEISSKLEKMNGKFRVIKEGTAFKTYLFINHSSDSGSGVISESIINGTGELDRDEIAGKLTNGKVLDTYDGHSLLSMSCLGKKIFSCVTDFWGIQTHYWHDSDDTFICSNNIFLISSLIEADYNNDALMDYLFFSVPLADATWFKNIQCLMPGQQLIVDLEEKNINLTSGTDFSCLSKPSEVNLIDAVKEFFLQAKNNSSPDSVNQLGLSSGSDSRTLLACLRHFDMKFDAISYGRDDMAETGRIRNLVNTFGVNWRLADMAGFENNFDSLFTEGTFISSGLLNPLRTHYKVFYDQVPAESNYFEGYLGSEFIKGEISFDGFIAYCHRKVISDGLSIEQALEECYPELSDSFKSSMAERIDSKYGAELKDINTEEGFSHYQQFAFRYIPSKMFGGLISQVLANGISPYYPFLSPRIVRAVFTQGYGIHSSVSLRRDFVGPIKSIGAEAEIVKYMDNRIYNSLLDRNISFRDVSYPPLLGKLKRKYHALQGKLLTDRNLLTGQIDNARIRSILEEIVKSNDSQIFPVKKKNIITNPLLTKAIVNMIYLQRVRKAII